MTHAHPTETTMTGRTGKAVLRHREDWFNVLRIFTALPIFLIPAAADLALNPAGLIIAIPIWFCVNDLNFLQHQHVHRTLFTDRTLNWAATAVLSVMTGMTGSNWNQQHVLRHHQLDDRWGHAFTWEFRRKSLPGVVSYSVRGAPIIVLWPFAEAIRRSFTSNATTPIRYRRAAVGQALTLAVVAALIVRTPWFYAPTYAAVWIFTRRTDYENHAGCDDTPLGFANNQTDRRYNHVRNNFGFHTAHHLHPQAHWTELPALHDNVAEQIPPDRFEPIGWSRVLNPGLLHYLATQRQQRKQHRA